MSTTESKPDLTTAIEQAAGEPLRAKDPTIEVQAHSIPDLIAGDNHLRKIKAAKRRGLPVRISRTRLGPPGGH